MLTRNLALGSAYGTGVDREAYLRPPKIEYMPETAIRPAFYVDDPQAQVLGVARSTGKPGLAVKDFGEWRSVYSSAPLLPWPLLRDIAREGMTFNAQMNAMMNETLNIGGALLVKLFGRL